MTEIPWLLVAILFALLVLGVVTILATKKRRRPPDYYTLFIMGIIWLPLGIPLDNYALSVMGLVFMIIGLANKSKWKENRMDWKSLTKEEKALKLVLVAVLGLLVLAGLGVFFLVDRGIINF